MYFQHEITISQSEILFASELHRPNDRHYHFLAVIVPRSVFHDGQFFIRDTHLQITLCTRADKIIRVLFYLYYISILPLFYLCHNSVLFLFYFYYISILLLFYFYSIFILFLFCLFYFDSILIIFQFYFNYIAMLFLCYFYSNYIIFTFHFYSVYILFVFLSNFHAIFNAICMLFLF
jgi:hypothetical protein